MWSCQYWRRTAIQDHIAGQCMWMSSMWPPIGMSSNSPLSGVVVCVNSGVRSHLGITGAGKVSWSFQCWVPHSMIASTSTANFCAWSPNADKHLTASWSGLRVQKIMVARLLMYDWAFFMTSSFSFRNLNNSFENAECPASRMSFWAVLLGIDRAFPALVVTTKLLAYEVHVYLTLCPRHACDSLTSYSYCICGFYFAGDSLTFSDFCCVPGRVPTGDPPLFSSDHGRDPHSVLPNRVAHQEHHRGPAVVAF